MKNTKKLDTRSLLVLDKLGLTPYWLVALWMGAADKKELSYSHLRDKGNKIINPVNDAIDDNHTGSFVKIVSGVLVTALILSETKFSSPGVGMDFNAAAIATLLMIIALCASFFIVTRFPYVNRDFCRDVTNLSTRFGGGLAELFYLFPNNTSNTEVLRLHADKDMTDLARFILTTEVFYGIGSEEANQARAKMKSVQKIYQKFDGLVDDRWDRYFELTKQDIHTKSA